VQHTKRQPADPAKAVDGNTNGHIFLSDIKAWNLLQPNRRLYRSRKAATTGRNSPKYDSVWHREGDAWRTNLKSAQAIA
jgi:hypothetical protein